MIKWNEVTLYEDPREHVTKLVFKNPDAIAEAVVYRYPTFKERTVICCSVQSGCKMGCVFCGTGNQFVRSLTGIEIVEQVRYAMEQVIQTEPRDIEKFQIMFMSMGEPLLNPYVESAIQMLGYEYNNAQLLLSTSAPDVPLDWLFRVSNDIDRVGLQFSVHASSDMERDKLIPFHHKMNLQKIATVGECWHAWTGRKPFFNYCAGPDNTSPDNALELKELFDPRVWCATVSVICNTEEGVAKHGDVVLAQEFSSKLVAEGFDVRIFDPAGQDTIGGGCGQLWYTQQWMKDRVGA